eukprot:CAMPEP_0113483004 /NCGR_PEP_ID=MMETSP0014_2-20120614/23210_1 /TAXON_ID=2857 /ORGANISM="Nitzschia sp." /LENGTH=514 /DNA_ID=CAMNT_0000376537 /DNA_START=4 /DNA_END=1548 /DNA_ORIENTATION=+ /assembly_acc=CAM_ASM_000159
MTSLSDPSTGYTGMENSGAAASSPSNDPERAAGQHGHHHHHSASKNDYQKMASELPPVDDRFQDEVGDDDDDGIQSVSSSIASSVLTADGIHDMSGFYIVCLVILVGDMSRGVFFPSMWPLVDELGGTSVTLGYSVAAFSFGRILVSPLFGGWSVTYGYTKTLTFSCTILLIGTLLFAQIQNVGRTEFLIFSQCILGLGSGTLGVTRAFIADCTAQRNRTTYMAWITAVQYAGFTVTPFIGALFNLTLQNVDLQWGPLRLNMFTAPAYFMSSVVILTLVLMRFYFRDRTRHQTAKDNNKKSAKRAAIDDHANQMTFVGLTVYDCCILGCMMLNVSTKGTIGSFETMGVSLAESHFDMESSRAGAIVGTCGTLGVIALLSMGYLSQKFTDIQLICGGMVIMCAGILSLVFLDDDQTNPSWQYVFAIYMMYSVGYPIGHTAVIGLFSKIVGRRPQGTLLGWFASAGSLARVIFPIMSGYITRYFGIPVLFLVLISVLAVSTIVTMYNRTTLIFLSQ